MVMGAPYVLACVVSQRTNLGKIAGMAWTAVAFVIRLIQDLRQVEVTPQGFSV